MCAVVAVVCKIWNLNNEDRLLPNLLWREMSLLRSNGTTLLLRAARERGRERREKGVREERERGRRETEEREEREGEGGGLALELSEGEEGRGNA